MNEDRTGWAPPSVVQEHNEVEAQREALGTIAEAFELPPTTAPSEVAARVAAHVERCKEMDAWLRDHQDESVWNFLKEFMRPVSVFEASACLDQPTRTAQPKNRQKELAQALRNMGYLKATAENAAKRVTATSDGCETIEQQVIRALHMIRTGEVT